MVLKNVFCFEKSFWGIKVLEMRRYYYTTIILLLALKANSQAQFELGFFGGGGEAVTFQYFWSFFSGAVGPQLCFPGKI